MRSGTALNACKRRVRRKMSREGLTRMMRMTNERRRGSMNTSSCNSSRRRMRNNDLALAAASTVASTMMKNLALYHNLVLSLLSVLGCHWRVSHIDQVEVVNHHREWYIPSSNVFHL